jgi:uracil-DNA glycosylase
MPRLPPPRRLARGGGHRDQAGRLRRIEPYWGAAGSRLRDPDATVLVVGLAPAATGPTGPVGCSPATARAIGCMPRHAPRRMLRQPARQRRGRGTGCACTGLRITAPVRCAPPATTPVPTERQTCCAVVRRGSSPSLRRRPRSVRRARRDRLGRHARRRPLAGRGRSPRPAARFKVTAWSSSAYRRGPSRAPRGAPAVGSYHVSQQNTFTGRLTEPMLDDVLGRALAI